MKAVLFDKIGLPSEVLYVGEVDQPEIGENNVLIRMVAASINPGDFLFIQNLYPEPKKPVLPRQIGGNHGAGIVIKGGKNTTVKPGTYVAFSYFDTWAEYTAVPEEFLIELPDGYPIEKAAQFVNLVTAWDLVTDAHTHEGDWLAVTAGNSAVSIMAIQFARRKGVNVISIVRSIRPELDMNAVGASAVIDLSKLDVPVKDKIMAITGGKGINGIVDNVGGPLLADLISSTAFNSKVVINGGQSNESYVLHNFDILLNGLEIRSYVYRYFFDPPLPGDKDMLKEIMEVSLKNDFYTPVGGFFEMDTYHDAIRNATENPSGGKTIFIFKNTQN
jgi:NADPH:quinone reductase-like Zn-dependent oxidoreductase